MGRLVKLCLQSLLLGQMAAGAACLAQAPGASSFLGSAAASPPSNAPAADPALVRAAAVPGAQPLVLPRNFRITPGSARTNVPGKISYYFGSIGSLRTFAEAFAIAGVPHITAAPERPMSGDANYQQELNTYGDQLNDWFHVNEKTLRYHADRLAVGFAAAETRDLLSNLALPLVLHQQARYIPAPVNSDLSQRMENAAASIVVTRSDTGALVPNYSKLGGTVAAAYLAKAFYADAFHAPELNSTHFVTHYVAYSLLGDMATNVAHELVRAAREPDMTMYDLHGRATDDSYYPLSIGGKLIYWARSTYAPRNFISAALTAGLPNINLIENRPQDPKPNDGSTWNGNATYNAAYEGYGEALLVWKDQVENDLRSRERRFAGGLGEAETQTALQNLAIPMLFNMDPRYVPLGAPYSGGRRLAHAFEGILVTHTDAGNRTVNFPVLGGTVGAAYLAKEVYYPVLGTPALETNKVLATTIGLNLAADAMYNVIGEFLRHRGY